MKKRLRKQFTPLDSKHSTRFVKLCFLLAILGFSLTFIFLCVGCQGQKGTANIASDFEPAFLSLHRSGELRERGEKLWKMMENCKICPRRCGINRLAGKRGFCRIDSQLVIASYQPHFGEERPLVGRGGSGAIFFSNCGLRCVFCINWQIAWEGIGRDRSIEDLAAIMLRLQRMGVHNINLVTPGHYIAHIVLALDIAAGEGLRLPIVYNSSGYECLDVLKMLDGVVDIYLPDFKYYCNEMAARHLSGARDYPEVAKKTLMEMYRQVGVAKPDPDGLIRRGMMVRHLVMPNRVAGTKEIIKWIAENLPKDTYINIMSQYRPMHKAFDYPEIARRLTREEYNEVVRWAREAGLTNLDIQRFWP